MPAPAEVRPRERLAALAAVVLIQGGLILGLLSGFRVDVARTRDSVERLIDVQLPFPPPPPPVQRSAHPSQAAPKAAPAPPGGPPVPKPAPVPPAPLPVVTVHPSAPAAGGGTGSGTAAGSGAGGGSGGQGTGDGGTDLEQIAGDIYPTDYPKHLGNAGVGGHVSFTMTVEPNGRVGRCVITRSSGIPELDALTCRLVQQRFVFRPSTDRFGHPIEDEEDGDYDWIVSRR